MWRSPPTRIIAPIEWRNEALTMMSKAPKRSRQLPVSSPSPWAIAMVEAMKRVTNDAMPSAFMSLGITTPYDRCESRFAALGFDMKEMHKAD